MQRFKNLCATDLKTLISKDRVIPPRGTKDSASWVQAGELLQSMSAFPDAEQGHQLAVRGINAVEALIKPMASSNRNGKDDADVILPSPNEIYASASLATKAALYSGSQEVGAYVLEELLHVAELCVNVAMELPLTVKEAGNVALQLACASARNVKQLILRFGYERSMTLQDAATRLQLLVLASAHLYELEFAVSCSSLTNNSMDLRLWAWDIASPLDRDERLDPTKYPAECLLRVFMEAFAVLFATAWTFQSSDVRNAFIPLATAFSERESVMLLLGRLMNVVEGDEEISRLLLPLLTDTLAARAAELSTRTYAVAAHVLASMAASCAQGGNQWGYRLVVDLLIKLYKFPQFSISASLLFGKSSPHPEALSSPMSTGAQVAVSAATSQGPQSPSRHVPGALSFALKVLADGLVAASLQYRKDYCRRLLSLFSDFALLLPNESYIRDLGALLPAIAAILPTLQEKRRPSSSATGGFGLSSTSLSLDTLSTLQDEGRTFNASLRHLWLYSSIYDFGMIAGGVGNSDDAWPSPWSQALSSIASATPVLILGSEQQKPEAFLEDISVEYESWLVKLKKRGEGTNLMKQLYKIIGSPAGGGSLSAPLAAHVLSIAYKSQCIASYHPSYGCSVEPVLEHMRHSLTTATEYPWLKQTLSIVFSTQMQTLKRYLASPVRSEEKDMYAADLLNATLEVLTPFLISHGPYNDVPNSAFDLLTDLTRQYPALLFEDRALSSAFQAITMAAANDNDSSLVRKYVLDLVKRAASISPGPAEALVVETLRHMAVREWRQPEIAVRFTPAVVQAVDQGRRLCSLPDVSRPYTGFIAWSAKVNAMGSINGLNTAESCVGGLPGGAAACCGRFLIDAFRDAAPDRLIIPKFIQATAVIVGNEISPLTAHLLRLVTWGQLLKFDSEIMAAATMCWHWLLAAGNTEVKTLVMESLVSAWISSRDEKMGMFRRNAKVEESDIQGVRAHHAWVVFFLEIWVAHRYDVQMTSSPFQNAIHKLLDSSICSMEPILISDHHITLGARFRLLQLALNFAGFIKENGAVTSTFAGSSATQIFSRTLFNALSWFAQPISWFESKAEESLELVAAMQDFADELSKAMTIFIGDILPSASGQSTLEEQGLLLKFLLKIGENLYIYYPSISSFVQLGYIEKTV